MPAGKGRPDSHFGPGEVLDNCLHQGEAELAYVNGQVQKQRGTALCSGLRAGDLHVYGRKREGSRLAPTLGLPSPRSTPAADTCLPPPERESPPP